MTATMRSVLGLLIVIGTAAVLGLIAFLVQRTWGSRWLWLVWLMPALLFTAFLLTRVDYTTQTLFSRPVLGFALAYFTFMSLFAGEVVWCIALWFGSDVPSTAAETAAGPMVDRRGLTGITRCYERLLTIYESALQKAPINPYPSIPRAVCLTLRGFLPSTVRQARRRVRHMGDVPNILPLDLTGAEDVLAEVDALTPVELAAIETCHRLNVRRLRQRSVMGWGWSSKLARLVAATAVLVSAAEYVGLLKLKNIDAWSLLSGITLWGTDTPSVLAKSVSAGVIVMLLLFIMNGFHFLPIFQRLQAFEDILSIAKAYRTGVAGTPKPAASAGTSTGGYQVGAH
jgi:hypothetical protein